jgi:hypothetical protein
MTSTNPLPPDLGFEQPELFPEIMIYMVVRLAADGRWSDSVRVSTPDNSTVVAKYGRSGGIMMSGEGKCIGDLQTAFIHAKEALEPFVIVQADADSYPC